MLASRGADITLLADGLSRCKGLTAAQCAESSDYPDVARQITLGWEQANRIKHFTIRTWTGPAFGRWRAPPRGRVHGAVRGEQAT
jgi:hypothetical protein